MVDELRSIGIVLIVLDRSKCPLKEGWEAVPIPLTPEVLEKCGAYLKRCDHFCNYYKLGILVIKRLIIESVFYCDIKDFGEIEVKHLHQLQNLYYALTGKELEYKP